MTTNKTSEGEVLEPEAKAKATLRLPTLPQLSPRLESCATCRCFSEEGKSGDGRIAGKCRAKSPSTAIIPLGVNKLGTGIQSTTISDWPVVFGDQFCIHDFVARGESPAQ